MPFTHRYLIVRLEATFETLSELEHHRGHLLNWYNTQNLDPLLPRYVSTVDSGNLAACLVVVKQACLAFADNDVLRPQRWQGLLDTLGLLEETLNDLLKTSPDAPVAALLTYIASLRKRVQAVQATPEQWATLISWLNQEAWTELSRLIVTLLDSEASMPNAAMLGDLRISSERFHHHLENMQRDIEDIRIGCLRLHDR